MGAFFSRALLLGTSLVGARLVALDVRGTTAYDDVTDELHQLFARGSRRRADAPTIRRSDDPS